MISSAIFYVTLLLVVNSEWVEITQQRYRKHERPSSVNAESNGATIENKYSPYHKPAPATSSKHPDVQSVKLGSSGYANITLNHNRSIGSAFKVPENIAGIEYLEKPINRYEEIDINSGEFTYNTEHVTKSPNIIRLASVSNNVKSMSEAKKDNSNKNGNLYTVRRKDPDQNDNSGVKQTQEQIDRITHNFAEKSLEIFEISIPHNDSIPVTPIKINENRKKGSINRIYMYSTKDPNTDLHFVTDKPHQPELTYKYSSDKSKPQHMVKSDGNEQRVTKASVPVSKGTIRRIYIHDITKSDEPFINNDKLDYKISPTKVISEDYGIRKNNESKSNDTLNTRINRHFQKIPVGETKSIVKINLNNIKTPKEPIEFSTRKKSTIIVAQDRLNTSKLFAHALQNNRVGDKAIDEKNLKPNELLFMNNEDNNVKTTDTPISDYDKGEHIMKISKPNSHIKQKSKDVVNESAEEIKINRDDYQTAVKKIRQETFSIKRQTDPEFVTKQEFIDDYDAKDMYKDYEEMFKIQNASSLTSTGVDKSHKNITQDILDGNEKDKRNKSEMNLNKKINVEISDKPNIHKDIYDDTLKSSDGSNGNETSEKAKNPLENIIKFMKIVSDTISKNTHRGVKSKMRYLEDLRDTLLMNIQNRVDETWPDDDSPQHMARKRREAHGHVEFPSSESALMSISFLTFAVFLIKLVLQVISTYKNKAMMMPPAVFAVSRAADAMKKPEQGL